MIFCITKVFGILPLYPTYVTGSGAVRNRTYRVGEISNYRNIHLNFIIKLSNVIHTLCRFLLWGRRFANASVLRVWVLLALLALYR